LQVIDNRRPSSAYTERRISSIREKEPRQSAADVGSAVESATPINNSTPKERVSEEEVSDGDTIDWSDGATDCGSSGMELQTYKLLASLLPAEEHNIEETPPVSTFVIEVDVVNHATPDHLRLTLEESRDRIDVAGG
jgi:hypothetical protein